MLLYVIEMVAHPIPSRADARPLPDHTINLFWPKMATSRPLPKRPAAQPRPGQTKVRPYHERSKSWSRPALAKNHTRLKWPKAHPLLDRTKCHPHPSRIKNRLYHEWAKVRSVVTGPIPSQLRTKIDPDQAGPTLTSIILSLPISPISPGPPLDTVCHHNHKQSRSSPASWNRGITKNKNKRFRLSHTKVTLAI